MRAAVRLTRLSEDTLRAWERRYQAVVPRRSGNRRLFTASDLKRLTLLREAVEQGHPIRDASRMSDAQLQALRGRSSPAPKSGRRPAAAPELFDGALERVRHYDCAGVDRELTRLSSLMPPVEFVHRVALPLMREVGIRWHRGELGIAQEHMVTAALRSIMGTMIRLNQPAQPVGNLLFATLPGERHELGLMAGAMLAASGGLGAIYLGAEVPAEELHRAAKLISANAVVLCAVNQPVSFAEPSRLSGRLAGRCEVWLGTRTSAPGRLHKGLRLISSLDALRPELIRLGARLPGWPHEAGEP
jgi:DNA-binding transcriptional MerR regulator